MERFRPLAAAALAALAGCAAPGYEYGRFRPPDAAPTTPAPPDRGGPDQVLDGMAAVVDAPARLLPVGPPTRRGLSPETEARLAAYLHENDLDDVHVSVNCYDPGGEWRRLRANDRIGAGWRYTAGALSVARYAVIPGRVFGVNAYNPYTDTLSVNSDRPVSILYEAAVAKGFRGTSYPGTVAAVTAVPGISLARDVPAANDVLSYARARNDWPTERAAYRELYPRVVSSGTSAVMPAGMLVGWWLGPAVGLGGAAVGHGAGWVAETRRSAEVAAGPK